MITQGSGNGSAADGSRNVCVEDSNNEVTDKDVKDDLESPNVRSDFREGPASITDYSPEWAYPEGGVKVLVTGPWYSSTSRYTVLFDSFPVPTMLVQSGVLRCFCPGTTQNYSSIPSMSCTPQNVWIFFSAHEVGLATVQVACEGFVISNSVMFEYKRPPHDDSMKLKEPKLEVNENLLKFTLLQRLEAVDGCLHIKQEPGGGDMVNTFVWMILTNSYFVPTFIVCNFQSDAPGLYHQGTNFEERMVNYCQEMTNRQWRAGDESSHTWMSGLRGMTLLHLAASLGYARLVCTMLHWRAENSSLLLETEVDALSQDDEGFTPLVTVTPPTHNFYLTVCCRCALFPPDVGLRSRPSRNGACFISMEPHGSPYTQFVPANGRELCKVTGANCFGKWNRKVRRVEGGSQYDAFIEYYK